MDAPASTHATGPADPAAATSAAVHHTVDDLVWLQQHLDDSYRRGGGHLLGIHTPAARVDAADLVAQLASMHVMVLATVSSDGRPFTGPVDAFLHHGRVVFGTSKTALRARHLARHSAASVTFVDGERLVMTMHGRARRLDLAGRDREFAQRLEAYYGAGWGEWGAGEPYFAIEPDRVLAADMSVHTSQGD